MDYSVFWAGFEQIGEGEAYSQGCDRFSERLSLIFHRFYSEGGGDL